MTSQPKAEDLTLPEPARTLLSRIRGILDTYVTPRTPDRSGWTIGGGTILAARWRHRESRDIDLLVHPRTETRFLQPAAAPELHRRLEAAGACDRPDDLANWFEQDGINALLSGAGIDPARIRGETESAMRTGGNTVILELDQDRSAWAPYLPKMGEAPG